MTRKSYLFLMGCALTCSILANGCGGSSDGDSEESTETSQANTSDSSDSQSTDVSHASGNELVGVWLGVAYIDVDKFNSKLETVADIETQNQMLKIAQSFQTTKLGVEFNDQQTYVMDMEIIATNGNMLRGQTEGEWKVVSQEQDIFVIETKELNEAGESETKQTQYRMIDKDHFAFVPPVDPSLLDCDPLIVFERQTLEDADSTADTAQQPAVLAGEDLR